MRTQVVPSPLRLSSAAECVRFERESFGALHQMLSGLPEPGRGAVWEEIEEELCQFEARTASRSVRDGRGVGCQVGLPVGEVPKEVIHPRSAWKRYSPELVCSIPHRTISKHTAAGLTAPVS